MLCSQPWHRQIDSWYVGRLTTKYRLLYVSHVIFVTRTYPRVPCVFSFHFTEPWRCHRMSHSGGTQVLDKYPRESLSTSRENVLPDAALTSSFVSPPVPPMHCRQPLQNLYRRRLDGDASVWHCGELWIQSEQHQWWCEWGGTTVTLRAGGWKEFN